MIRRPYDTDLTDALFAVLEPLLPPPKARGRPRADLRAVLDGILYLVRSGCQWRLLPHDFPPWSTVHTWHRRRLNGSRKLGINGTVSARALISSVLRFFGPPDQFGMRPQRQSVASIAPSDPIRAVRIRVVGAKLKRGLRSAGNVTRSRAAWPHWAP
jgi:transposase